MKKEKYVLTLEAVKSCIGYPPESLFFSTLSKLCDMWHEHAKREGSSDEEAAEYAFKRLSETMLKMGEEKED